MKANVPKCWAQLKPSDKKKIEDIYIETYKESLKNVERTDAVYTIMISCFTLQKMGFETDKIMEFVGTLKTLGRQTTKPKTAEALRGYLQENMHDFDEIIGYVERTFGRLEDYDHPESNTPAGL